MKKIITTFRLILFLTMSTNTLTSFSPGQTLIRLEQPVSPPAWALLERHLLDENAKACREFFHKYFDDRGYLLCVERWGGNDGPDDAIENCNDWPLLHALGGHDDILRMYKKAWEGHLQQYTQAKTKDVPFATDGMYYKEFPVTFDWLHNAEGLTVFNLQGLSDPTNSDFQRRVRRFAGFYMNEDPGAPNYDPQHKIIRSMFNGSRGPLLRKATAVDWAGDPIEINNRFNPLHGENNYEQMLAHFEDYNDIVGDHPQNLLATSLAMNGLCLSGDSKYRQWVLEYVSAWRERMKANGNIIPTNIGLDGTPGGNANGKWYGGVYGWAFSVTVPQNGSIAHRNTHAHGFVGFMNAYMLTGDDSYLECWRKQIDTINSHVKIINGKPHYPSMYGDNGWYAYSPSKYSSNTLEIFYLSMKDQDRLRVADHPWIRYLQGENDSYVESALRADLAEIRRRVQGIRIDKTTPDTRLADDPMHLNPARVTSLIPLMLGGIHPGRRGSLLHCRLRYFDPLAQRAGLPRDVGALVRTMTADSITVQLVNTSQTERRQVAVQAGSYGEHQFVQVQFGQDILQLNSPVVYVQLAPGCGGEIIFSMQRYVNPPTFHFPWQRMWATENQPVLPR